MKIKLTLLILAGIITINSPLLSQQFFYSAKQKQLLAEDTTKLVVRLKSKGLINTFIRKMSSDLAESFDTLHSKESIEIKLKQGVSKSKALTTLRKFSEVIYSWQSLKSNNINIIPTGEIELLPAKGNSLDSILYKTNTADLVQVVKKSRYGVVTLKPTNEDSIFSIANKIYESNLVSWALPVFWEPIVHSNKTMPNKPVPTTNITNNQFKKFTSDALFGDQWYLKNTGQFSGTSGIDINAEAAWSITTGAGTSIVVAVLDEGVDDHEDFTGRVLSGLTLTDPLGLGAATDSHGVACSGIIAATQNNTIGIAGIAPNSLILPVNIFAGSPSTSDVANGINWAWDDGGADVLSNSWTYTASVYYDNIAAAIQNARTEGRSGKGSLVVFSAGNNYSSVAFPANVSGVIAVGAIDNNGNIFSYSNTGSTLSLVAPSSDGSTAGIRTTDRMGTPGYTTTNYTTTFDGTSAACPQVSGVGALMLSVNPNLTEGELRSRLQSTATDMGTTGFDNTFGYGRVNACAAVAASFAISGNDIFCSTSGTYSVPNLPSGVSISWSVSPSGYASISSSGNAATLSKIADGYITLTAAVSSLCGTTYTTSKPVQVGSGGDFSTTLTFDATCGTYLQDIPFNLPLTTTGFVWTMDYNTGSPIYTYLTDANHGALLITPIVPSPTNGTTATHYVQVKAVTSCGTGNNNSYIDVANIGPIYTDNCGGGGGGIEKIIENPTNGIATMESNAFTVYPNPSHNSLKITIPKDSINLGHTIIKLLGVDGRLFRMIPNATEVNTVDIGNIANGTYLIEITDGKKRYLKKIVKN